MTATEQMTNPIAGRARESSYSENYQSNNPLRMA
jgi:hypothetical protein